MIHAPIQIQYFISILLLTRMLFICYKVILFYKTKMVFHSSFIRIGNG